MIEKLREMLTPRDSICMDDDPIEVELSAEEAANIFGVLLSVANLLDSPALAGKDLADCLAKGMERMIVATEDMSNVQAAWGKLV